jgi:hypothetical protein
MIHPAVYLCMMASSPNLNCVVCLFISALEMYVYQLLLQIKVPYTEEKRPLLNSDCSHLAEICQCFP